MGIFPGVSCHTQEDISALFVKSHTHSSAEDGPLVIEINWLIIDRHRNEGRAPGLK